MAAEALTCLVVLARHCGVFLADSEACELPPEESRSTRLPENARGFELAERANVLAMNVRACRETESL